MAMQLPCTRWILVLSLGLVLVPLSWPRSHGQAPKTKQPPTTFECRWADAPIKITGKGTDPAWKNAQAIDYFYLPWLGEKARPSKTKTKAKLLWDREYLYFFADMEDTDLYADIKEHDGMLWFNDVFELFFKPADDKPGYYEFQVNAAGAVLDMFLPRRRVSALYQGRRFPHRRQGPAARHAQQMDRQGRRLVGRGQNPLDRFSTHSVADQRRARSGSSPCAVMTTPSTSRGRSCRPTRRSKQKKDFPRLRKMYATLIVRWPLQAKAAARRPGSFR